MIKPKSELDQLRENLASAEWDLLVMRRYEQTPAIMANVRHKEEYIRQLRRKIDELEELEKYILDDDGKPIGEQMSLFQMDPRGVRG